MGDSITLKEYTEGEYPYTGRSISATISNITDSPGLQEGYVALGLRNILFGSYDIQAYTKLFGAGRTPKTDHLKKV